MKRFRTLIALLLVLTAALALSPAAAADLVWGDEIKTQEWEDEFYASHYRECQTAYRYFETMEDCVLQISPEDPTVEKSIGQKTELFVLATWNGWGLVDFVVEEEGKINDLAWVELSRLRKVFVFNDVDKRVYGKVVDLYSSPKEFPVEDGRSLCLYTFPGSGILKSRLSHGPVSYFRLWTDPLGRDWGYLDGDDFTERGWICLDDPYTDLPRIWPDYVDEDTASLLPSPLPKPVPSVEPEPTPVPSSYGLPRQLIGLVAGLTVVTALMIALVIRSGKKKRRGP